MLNDTSRTLIYQIHQQSDWVVTIDRNFGVDLFDLPTDPDCPPYLLDYKPGTAIGEPPVFLTTRPSSEISGLLTPYLQHYDLVYQHSPVQLAAFLEVLRSVSGSVIMQFLSSPNKAFEAIGIALSRLLLEHLDLLQEHCMIPLDVHQDLFHIQDEERDFSQQRGDFLLVSCDSTTGTLYIQVVETKCRTSIGDGLALTNLKSGMTEQLEQTITSLQHHFDPSLRIPDRLDRPLKDRQLYQLLDFYLKRAFRYHLLSQETFEEYQHTLAKLHAGYTLSFHQIGLIFEFEGQQEEILSDTVGPNLVFFHLGRPMIERPLTQLGGIPPAEEKPAEPLTDDLERMQTTLRKSRRASSIRYHTDFSSGEQIRTVDTSGEYTVEGPLTAGLQTQHEQLQVAMISSTSLSQNESPEFSSLILEDTNFSLSDECLEDTLPPPQPAEEYETPRSTDAQVAEVAEESYETPEFSYLIGEDHPVPQYGLLASTKQGCKIALDLNGCNTISLFGVPGSGKSYTLGSIVEMATQRIPAINKLPGPLATVIFHYNESQDYPPEFVSMCYKNDNEREIELLKSAYGAEPASLEDVILLAPKDKVEQRQQEYSDVIVAPIAFASSELSIKDWKFLMGAIGNQAMYIRHINMIMQRGRNNLTLDFLREQIEESFLSDAQKMYAQLRLDLAAQFIDDATKLRDLLTPGKLLIVDLRDEFIEKEQALGLFVVMLNIFAGVKKPEGETFNKLIVFDEAHKYITHSELTSHVVTEIREMRHKGVTLLLASQDPPSLPNEVIELSSVIILHRFNSPKWLNHIQKSSIALKDLTPTQLSQLQPGEAFLWANKATNAEWTRHAIKVLTRPRITKHGGSTQKAIE